MQFSCSTLSFAAASINGQFTSVSTLLTAVHNSPNDCDNNKNQKNYTEYNGNYFDWFQIILGYIKSDSFLIAGQVIARD